MGRKKGKQRGMAGSKKMRYASEQRRFADARDDLARISVAPIPFQRKRVVVVEEKQRVAVETTAAVSDDAPKEEPQETTLFGLCCVCIGRNLDRYVGADDVFDVLPSTGMELISRWGKMTDEKLPLFARSDLKTLSVNGDVTDLQCLVPRRRDDPPDSWESSGLLFDGCFSLHTLNVDAPVDLRNLWLPSLRTLILGPQIRNPMALLDALLFQRMLPGLTLLDLRKTNFSGLLLKIFTQYHPPQLNSFSEDVIEERKLLSVLGADVEVIKDVLLRRYRVHIAL